MLVRALFFAIACFASSAFAASADELLVKVGLHHLKQARYGATAVTDGKHVYVVGGADDNGLLTTVERFDIGRQASEVITDQLIPRHYGAAALVGQKIYIFGGWTHTLQRTEPDARVEVLDLATGKITQAARMPRPRAHAAPVVFHGLICLIGGQVLSKGNIVTTGIMEIYDPAGDRWSEGPAMPTPRETKAALVGDFIVAPAGFASGAASARVELFVPKENQWKALPDLHTRISACSIAFLGEHLFLFGDYGNLSSVVAYSLRDRTSRAVKTDFVGARHSSAVVCSDRIFVCGGNDSSDGNASDLIQVFALRNPPAAGAKK